MTATPASPRSRCASRAAACAALLLAAALAAPQAGARPRIGLVLGGGGARGGAHLGVLEVLEELRVPVDCIAGTSMGALVGGAYAAGVAPRDVEKLVGETDWLTMFDDSAGRRAVNVRRKELDDRFYAGAELGVSREGLRFREGAVSGEKLKLFFNRLVRSDLGDRSIEELALPLSIIATDIGTGERVAMRTGNLTTAMRASMSVPGLIAPVTRDDRKLVDGGLVDNLPVGEVKSLCNPDVVIAVNVGSPLLKPDQVTGVLTVLGQVVNLLTEQNVAKSRALLGPGDIYIQPDLGRLGSTDFTRQLEAAAKGREAAQAMAAELRRFSVPAAEYAAWQDRLRLAIPHAPPVIDEVQVAETRFVNPQTIRRGIRQQEGEPLDSGNLARDLVREFSQGDLSSLDYSVVRNRDRTILRITPVEKSWGPDYLRFGLNLSSDFRGDSRYNVRALYRRTWMNALGAEWLVGGQIGSEQSLGTEIYQPLDLRHVFFVRPYASTSLRRVPIYSEGGRLAVYRVQENLAGAELGMNLGVNAQATGGWVERRIGAVLDTGPDSFFNTTQEVGGPTAAFVLDTYDQPFFPTRGMRLDASYFDALHASAGFEPYAKGEARWGGAWSRGRWTLLGGLEGGATFKGTLPIGDAFALGGPRRLTGFANDQMLGGDYSLGRLEAQYRLNYSSPLWGLTLVGGLMAEAGRMNKPFTETSLTGWQRSISAYLAANTFLGPVYIGVADAKHGKARFYLFIGTP
ncbi:MAG TPA: patatin-like phospholipase family protein [Usitatibacter sp.]|nr:patatin-like phospholipase family protein [Usitatibacter sp.]